MDNLWETIIAKGDENTNEIVNQCVDHYLITLAPKAVYDRITGLNQIVEHILDIVQSGNIDDLGLMFKDHWEMKKRLSSGVTNEKIDSIYSVALENGAIGGKISGAGGGGFFTFYCNKDHQKLRNSMSNLGLKELEYSFDDGGSKIISINQ